MDTHDQLVKKLMRRPGVRAEEEDKGSGVFLLTGPLQFR